MVNKQDPNTNNKKVESVNIDFYNKLYKRKNIFLQLIHPFISYDQQSKSKPNYKIIRSLFCNLKNTDEFNFLDYGFGHGSLLLKIPRKNGLFGCDISDEAVVNFPRVAKLLGKNVVTFTPDQLHSVHAKFNLISSSHVLEHVDDDLTLLNKFYDLLVAKGSVLINVPINEVWEDPKHIRKYTSSSMRELLTKAGFTVVSLQEKNRLSAFLLFNERVKKGNVFSKLFFRTLRLFLALIPLKILESFDFLLSEKYKFQHLIVLAQKI